MKSPLRNFAGLILFATALFLESIFAATATHEKLFRLELQGKTSYILATQHKVDLTDLDLSHVDKALSHSNEVVFESDFLSVPFASELDFRTEDLGLKPELLKSQLSSGATKVLRKIVKPDDRLIFYSLKPGAALYFAKTKFKELREQLLAEYLSAIPHMSKPQLIATYGVPKISKEILEAAEMLLDGKFTDEELINWAFQQVRQKKKQPTTGLDHYVARQSTHLKVSFLENDPYFQLNTAIAHVNVNDLNQAMMAMGKLVEKKNIASQFWIRFIASSLLQTELSQYFIRDSRLLGSFLHLISTASPEEHLPGEEKAEAADLNRHKLWLDTLLNKIENGGVFIAVGGAHVIPGLDRNSHDTLLEVFESRGVRVTPIGSCADFLR